MHIRIRAQWLRTGICLAAIAVQGCAPYARPSYGQLSGQWRPPPPYSYVPDEPAKAYPADGYSPPPLAAATPAPQPATNAGPGMGTLLLMGIVAAAMLNSRSASSQAPSAAANDAEYRRQVQEEERRLERDNIEHEEIARCSYGSCE